MSNGFDFSEEAALTNAELAGQLATVTTLSAAEIERLLPTKADKKALAELIDIVNDAASQNDKVAKLRGRFGDLGGVVLKLLKTVVG
ncbi:MAG TPA: hypothetical protein VGA78_15855 [Gemmatimonadales bacterium]